MGFLKRCGTPTTSLSTQPTVRHSRPLPSQAYIETSGRLHDQHAPCPRHGPVLLGYPGDVGRLRTQVNIVCVVFDACPDDCLPAVERVAPAARCMEHVCILYTLLFPLIPLTHAQISVCRVSNKRLTEQHPRWLLAYPTQFSTSWVCWHSCTIEWGSLVSAYSSVTEAHRGSICCIVAMG